MARDAFNAAQAAHEKWLEEHTEHHPALRDLSERDVERIKAKAKQIWRLGRGVDPYDQQYAYARDKGYISENGELTPKGKLHILEILNSEEKRNFEKQMGKKKSIGRGGVANLEEEKSDSLRDTLSKYGLLSHAIVRVLSKRGNSGEKEYSVQFKRNIRDTREEPFLVLSGPLSGEDSVLKQIEDNEQRILSRVTDSGK